MNNCDMTRMAHMRVQKMDPENASMIVGYYLLRDNRDRELVISLAFGPDSVFQSLVANAQLDLGLLPSSLHSHPHLAPPSNNDCSVDPMYLPSLSPHSQSHLQLELQSQLLSELQSQLQPHTPYTNLCRGAGPAWSPYPQDLPECPSLAFSKLLPFCAAEQVLGEEPDQIGLMRNNNNNNNSNYNSFSSNPFIHPDQIYAGLNYGLGGGSGISSLGDPSLDSVTSAHKPCSYYARGFCKHGTSCKFLHIPMRFDPSSPHGSSQSQGQGQSQSRSQNQTQREIYNEDGLSSGSLERLEMELQNLLRGRRSPVSIASLPQLYYERYGKTLQAEGYLTESQRHGKAGYSLTKLLARLKNTVTLIDRPHGQHAVVLAEDAQKFISFRESEDQCGINPGSRQIYLTFPAESTFSEDDVSEHFKAYGPVQDVRIPYQQKRMFGFVTFVYSETVKAILSKGNPHYICGSRVLVKPYKEKGKQIEKKIVDRGEQSRYSSKAGLEIRELEFSPGLKLYNGGDPLFRDYEEQNQALLALDRRRLQQLQLQLVMEPHSQYPQETHLHHISLSNGYNPVLSGESTRIPEDLNNLQSSSALGYLLDVLDSDTGEVQVPPRHKSNSISHSDEHNLPESPFASPPMHAAATPLSNQLKALTLASSHDSDFSRFSTISLRCIICQGLMADPIQLECTHTFCIQCILEVIGVSRDECPLCRRNIGNQIVKLLENRGFPVIIDPSRGGGS